MIRSPFARSMARLEVREGSACWWWTGSATTYGYGQVSSRVDGKVRPVHAHRAVYEGMVAPIPAGMAVHHLCYNKRCCNPEHLLVCTSSEHASIHKRDYVERNPTCRVCGSDEWQHHKGKRHCGECNRRTSREWNAKKRAEKIK